METQMICFINKTKFMSLITDDFANEIEYKNLDKEQLIYIDENWKIELGPIEQGKADKAAYILVSDDFPLEDGRYIPQREFCLLIHTGTDYNKRVAPLLEKYSVLLTTILKRDGEYYKEEKGSKYDEIAQLIRANY